MMMMMMVHAASAFTGFSNITYLATSAISLGSSTSRDGTELFVPGDSFNTTTKLLLLKFKVRLMNSW
jgi:hypothetical protein